jgi:hypothetical protein
MAKYDWDWWTGENSIWQQLDIESIGTEGITFRDSDPQSDFIGPPAPPIGFDNNQIMMIGSVLVIVAFIVSKK